MCHKFNSCDPGLKVLSVRFLGHRVPCPRVPSLGCQGHMVPFFGVTSLDSRLCLSEDVLKNFILLLQNEYNEANYRKTLFSFFIDVIYDWLFKLINTWLINTVSVILSTSRNFAFKVVFSKTFPICLLISDICCLLCIFYIRTE